jgi:FixJ family two-component response regulator
LSHASTIAIVDDDQAIRESLDDLLQSYGYESRVFASAEAFLSHADRRVIGCMLVDVKMPGLSGIELQALLNDDPARPPMIFITSSKDERTRSAVMDGGAFAFLGKPVDVTQLMYTLEQALGSRRSYGPDTP